MKIYLTTGTSLVSKLIQLFTQSKNSHLAMQLDPLPLILHSTHVGVHYSYESKFLRKYKVAHCFGLKEGAFTAKDIEVAYAEVEKHLEDSYDFLSMAGFAISLLGRKLGFNWVVSKLSRKKAFFCSELFHVFMMKLCPKVMKGYKRERFSPQNAYEVMSRNPEVFVEL